MVLKCIQRFLIINGCVCVSESSYNLAAIYYKFRYDCLIFKGSKKRGFKNVFFKAVPQLEWKFLLFHFCKFPKLLILSTLKKLLSPSLHYRIIKSFSKIFIISFRFFGLIVRSIDSIDVFSFFYIFSFRYISSFIVSPDGPIFYIKLLCYKVFLNYCCFIFLTGRDSNPWPSSAGLH